MRRLIGVLLLTVMVISMFAVTGVIKPVQAVTGVGLHYFTALYYKAYIHDDHDVGVGDDGEWKFSLYAGTGWTPESYKQSGVGYCNFSGRSRAWYSSGSTSFSCRAREMDNSTEDYNSTYTVDISWPWPIVNTWHSSSYQEGDVTHYYKYLIRNLSPTASPISDQIAYVGQPVYFTGSGTDPEGDQITAYQWTFGDSTSSSLQNPTHSYTSPESYTVSFKVQDYFGLWSSAKTATVTVIPVGAEADLVRRSAWPEHHHFVLSKDGNSTVNDKDDTPGLQTIYGKVGNTGTVTLPAGTYKVVWEINSDGTSVGTYETAGTVALAPGDITTLTYNLDVSASPFGPGKYQVTAQCWYYGVPGDKTKGFSFSVVP